MRPPQEAKTVIKAVRQLTACSLQLCPGGSVESSQTPLMEWQVSRAVWQRHTAVGWSTCVAGTLLSKVCQAEPLPRSLCCRFGRAVLLAPEPLPCSWWRYSRRFCSHLLIIGTWSVLPW